MNISSPSLAPDRGIKRQGAAVKRSPSGSHHQGIRASLSREDASWSCYLCYYVGGILSAGLIQSTPTGYRLGFRMTWRAPVRRACSKEEVIKYVSRFLEQLGGTDIHVSSVSYCLVNVEPAGLNALPPSHDRSCVQVSMKSEVVCGSSSAHAVGRDKLVFQLKRLHQRVQVAPERGCLAGKDSVTFGSLVLE